MLSKVARTLLKPRKKYSLNLSLNYFASQSISDEINLDLLMTSKPLKETDSELYEIIQKEIKRQKESIVLIPSENYTSLSVLNSLGSVMQNKYSEGYPNARYYGGNEFIDEAELLCQKRALECFNLNPEEWGVNVQPLSGSPANFYAYTALLDVHARIMSLDLPSGGHLSHGYQTPSKKISAVSKYFEVLPYKLDESTGRIDYDKMEELARQYRPKLIIGGASAYSRFWDYERMKKLCDEINSIYLFDMAHISGLVIGGVHPSPFEYADIVTTTTHKTLRGPRGSMIFYKKGIKSINKKTNEKIYYDYESKINNSVFPGHQGGPHNHTISALCTALKQAKSNEFKLYQQRIINNNKSMLNRLNNKYNYNIVSGGSDNHLGLIDLRQNSIGGAQVERICELINLTLNKNTVPGDISALTPGGIRIGSPAMTTRGCNTNDFEIIGDFIHKSIVLAKEIQDKVGSKKIGQFREYLNNGEYNNIIKELKEEVTKFSIQFPLTGIDKVE